MKYKFLSIALIAVIAISSCGRLNNKDDENKNEKRIVCVSKQINEYIYDLGAEKDLVAVDLSSTFPEQIKKLPTVGYHRALSAEGIISAKPTLFLHDGNVGPEQIINQIKKVGIPVAEIKAGRSIDSARLLMKEVGKYFGKEKEADSVIKLWDAAMADVLKDTINYVGKPKPKVLIIHYGRVVNNYLAVTKKSPATKMLEWAGAVNVIDSAGGMARTSAEMIAKVAPDIIIATDFGFDKFGSAEKFKSLPGVALTPAAKNNRIYRIEENEIIYFSTRTPSVIKKLKQMIHTN